MVGQVLDRERIPLRVDVVERWDGGRAQPSVDPQRPRLCVVARRGHRPRGIGSHVRQRLLDHEAGGIAVGRLAADDEDEVEVAVADFAHRLDAGEPLGERAPIGDVVGDGVDGEQFVLGLRHLAPFIAFPATQAV